MIHWLKRTGERFTERLDERLRERRERLDEKRSGGRCTSERRLGFMMRCERKYGHEGLHEAAVVGGIVTWVTY